MALCGLLLPGLAGLLWAGDAPAKPPGANAPPAAAKPNRGYQYIRDEVAKVPWCVHIVKIERSHPDLELQTALGGGTVLGMSTVSQQVRLLPPEIGKPIAAINGDFFEGSEQYPGDPMGLQIARGELISAPEPSHSCMWVDASGGLHLTNVVPDFQVIWPDGKRSPFGLNRERQEGAAVLYTSAVGASTRAHGGLELVLERDGTNAWLPLQIGRTLRARVKELRPGGNSPLSRDLAVLSLAPQPVAQAPKVAVGAVLQLSTATHPDLAGARTALSGGPALLKQGASRPWSPIQARHPRTAVGWNSNFIFMIEVDGRQRHSVGMTFPEMADYMRKLGCTEALNLDGGGSATLWLLGNVMNSPSQGSERSAANALVLVQKNKP